jgi:hypothetical protein
LPKFLFIIPLILLYVCNLYSISDLYSEILLPRYLNFMTCSMFFSLFLYSSDLICSNIECVKANTEIM